MDGEFDNTYIIGYVIEGDCEWEPEHGIDIIILNDKVVDVGPAWGLTPWDDEEELERFIREYL